MTTDKQPEALRLAHELIEGQWSPNVLQNEHAVRTLVAAELRRQHERIAELEAQADDFTTRGLLAELKCWHRLTGPEADELVAFFSKFGAPQAPALTERVPLTIPTHDEIIELADETRTAEGGASGYILPVSFAHAVLTRWGTLPPRVPLTGAQVVHIIEKLGEYESTCEPAVSVAESILAFVRGIEAVHGIKDEDEGEFNGDV